MNRILASRYFPLIFIPISFLYILIYSWSTSPLFLGDGVDSSIFKTIGFGMAHGKLPYVDLFDHKGGLFFMIESLGFLISSGRWGLFLVQVVFLSATLMILFKTACLILDRKNALWATLAALLFYLLFMESGNQCETYMLPFTGSAFYLAVKYLSSDRQNPHPAVYSLIYGLCFAAVFWIRPNDAVSQIGSIMAGIFIYMLTRKEFSKALANAATFLAGCAIVTAPLVAFFAYHGCVMELLEGTFLYNLKYVSDSGMPSVMMLAVPSFIFGLLIWMSCRQKNMALNYIFIPMLILTLLLIGKRNYGHYLIIMTVPVLLMFAYAFKEKWRVFSCIILTGLAILSIRPHRYVLKSIEVRSQQEEFYSQTRRIISNVPESERASIWNLNLLRASNDDVPNLFSTLDAFIDSGITPCNRVFVPLHVDTFPAEETIQANMPEWVLADPTGNGFEKYREFLDENYMEIDSTDGTCVGDVVLYRRNDEER